MSIDSYVIPVPAYNFNHVKLPPRFLSFILGIALVVLVATSCVGDNKESLNPDSGVVPEGQTALTIAQEEQ